MGLFRLGSGVRPLGLLCLALTAVAAQPSAESFVDSPELPDSPAGACLRELLATIDGADPAVVETFVRTRYAPSFLRDSPLESHAGFLMSLAESTGGMEFHRTRSYSDRLDADATVAIVRARRTQQWMGIRITVEAEPPHRLESLVIMPARAPRDLPPGPIGLRQFTAELEQFLELTDASDTFSGAVLVARGDTVLFSAAYGLASKRFDVPNTVETRFNVGSIGKTFTAVAIAQLAERGTLSLDDPLSKHLDADWLPEQHAGRITIRHLLTHTSGLGGYFEGDFWDSSRLKYRDLNDYRPLVRDQSPHFEPGSAWAYSNTGYLLLGAVIEKLSGQSYDDYLRTNVFGPAGMDDSANYAMDRPVPNLAIGYVKRTERDGSEHWRNNLYLHSLRGTPAGGGFSTVGDLHRFSEALRTHQLLGEAMTEALWQVAPQSRDALPYGLGFVIKEQRGQRVVGHGGGFPGLSAQLDMHLDTGYTVVVLSNYSGGAPVVTRKIESLLEHLEGDASSAPVERP